MKLSKINMVNFRNYSNAVINFGKNMNVFVGDNAQGKTNILEAICYLALTKSHRVGTNPNIIMFNKKKAQIKGVVKKKNIIGANPYVHVVGCSEWLTNCARKSILKNRVECTIYNGTSYQLTHLLENGHLTRNGKKVPAIKHIEPVEQKCIKEYQKNVETIIKNGG